MESLNQYLQPIELPLTRLYLDPNNPRFVGSDWVYVPDAEAMQPPAQADAKYRLIQHHDVKKLQSSMEENGFLPIDRIVVRRIDDEHFMALEGNRRICAAKEINGFSDDGAALPPEIMATFNTIPCLEYTGENEANQAAWIFQGLPYIGRSRMARIQ